MALYRCLESIRLPEQLAERITELAQKIGAKTVAEGIETQEQLDFVKEARCDMIQGYIYARPMPVSEFERWIDQRQSPGNTN